jgi:hypothetical protein
MSDSLWGVFTSPPASPGSPRTWCAGLRRPDLSFEWRSLDTSSRETAHQWLRSAHCHGADNHHETCKDCAPRPNVCPKCHVNFDLGGCRCLPGFT